MALTTLANVKAWLGPTYNSSDDAVLSALIDSVSAAINSFLNRNIEQQTYTEYHNGSNNKGIRFWNWPVSSLTSVSVDGQLVPILQPDDFVSTGVKWNTQEPFIIANGMVFNKGYGNVKIVYTAGYDTDSIPNDIVQACNEIVAMRYKNARGDRLGVSSKGLAGETITFSQKDMPDSAKNALRQHMNVVPSW